MCGIEAKFELGQLLITPGAIGALNRNRSDAAEFIRRHASGDWGELDADDVRENEFSLEHGLRLLSSYRLQDGQKLWIITEANRSCTTVLLPEEY
jgi:hypothetical protein